MARRSWVTRSIVGLLGIGLAAVVSLERLDVMKTDTLAALSCSTLLVSDRPPGVVTIGEHRASILESADAFDLPPELLAANILSHASELTPFRAFTDCAGSAMGANLSLGPAQVRISTAASGDGRAYQSLTPAEFKAYRRALLVPASNIRFQARELRLLLDRTQRPSGLRADDVIGSPATMARVLSIYREGSGGSSRISGYALGTLELLLDDALYRYGRPEVERDRMQAGIGDYLDEIYCRSGIFNASACESWRRRRSAEP